MKVVHKWFVREQTGDSILKLPQLKKSYSSQFEIVVRERMQHFETLTRSYDSFVNESHCAAESFLRSLEQGTVTYLQ